VGTVNATTLRALVDNMTSIQKARIRAGNQLTGIKRYGLPGGDAVEEMIAAMEALEKTAKKHVEAEVKRLIDEKPILRSMLEIKGVGKWLAASIVVDIDIERASTISALWRYAGAGDAEADKPQKGERRVFNRRLKVLKHPEWGLNPKGKEGYKAHYHNHAIRKTRKLFLSHLWTTWRTLEGLPVTAPYAMGPLGHQHYRGPEEFGWPAANDPEKTNSSERATQGEKPRAGERAMMPEKPKTVERALAA
jgi:hypothetical protein